MNSRKQLAHDCANVIRYFNDTAMNPEDFIENMLYDTPEIVGKIASKIPYFPTTDECGIVEWCKLDTILDLFDHFVVDPDGPSEMLSAMYDSMSYCNKLLGKFKA